MKRIVFVFFLIVAMINSMTVHGQSAKQLQKAKELLAKVEKNSHASPSEHQQAVDALLKVADKHDRQEGEALLYLGEAYSRFVPQPFRDDSLSFHYYTNAAEKLPEGELKGLALYNMGVYFYKNSVHQDLAQAHSLFVLAAGFNDAVSVGAGETYEFGLGCPMNPSAAFAYYRKGIAAGADFYGKLYAIHYYMKQMEENTLDTMAYRLYREGVLEQSMGDKNRDIYEKKLLKSAERGYLPAQFELGTLMLQRDAVSARKWLKLAADSHYLPAVHQYGVACEYSTGYGIGVAYPYYKQAAEAGFPPAQCAMGVICQKGLAGVPANLSNAKSWYEAAADQGYPRASQLLEKVEKSIKAARWKLVLDAISQVAADIADMQQSHKFTPTVSPSTASPQSSSQTSNDSWKQKAEIAEKESRLLPLLHRDQKSYDHWGSMLCNMWAGHSTYSDRDRKNYQASMREIRLRWEAKGMSKYFYPSRWETWDGSR